MRILIAIGVPRQREAGAAAVALNHAHQLRKRGHEVDCWFLEDVLDRPALPKRLEALIFSVRAARRILRERSNYDVVNLHAPWGCVYGTLRSTLRPSGAPPYVLTMQGSEERFTHAMKAEHRKGRARNFGWKNRMWHRLYHQTMYDVAIRTADYGAVANREAQICAELKYGKSAGRIRYVPNGVEEQFFSEREYASKSPTRLLYVGTWLDRKGVYYLADAFNELARGAANIHLTAAGCGSAAEAVKNYFAPEIRNQVRVVPFVTRDQMPGIYAEHDIFVFPSLVEGMPLTLLEAMAAGMPVVTTESNGMADVVEDGVNGLVVRPADAPELAEAVRQLVASPTLRERLGRTGQETMRRYTWEKVVEKLERILLEATSGSDGG